MLTRNQLIAHWKRWMNRNRSFSKPEMEELESHLWEEMDEMVATDGFSEKEAFHKVISNLGNRTTLDSEYKKTKTISISRINSWTHDHLWQVIICFMIIIMYILGDFLYANNHNIERIQEIRNSESGLSSFKDNSSILSYGDDIVFGSESEMENFVVSDINALSKGIINLYPTYLYFVYDGDNIWISSTKYFNKKTKKVRINPPASYVEHKYSLEKNDFEKNKSIEENSYTITFSPQYSIREMVKIDLTPYYIGTRVSFVNFSDDTFNNFTLFYDDKYHTIGSNNSISYCDDSLNYIEIIKSFDIFFSEPDRSSFFLFEEEDLSFLIKLELMEFHPKTTTSFNLTFKGKSIPILNTTEEDKQLVLHWSLLKNIKEPIHLHQAIFTSIQKFFKAGSNKNNQSNSFNIKETQSNANP